MKDWHAELIDRAKHRAPVDAHFADAFAWIGEADQVYPVLELGPGPERDIVEQLERMGRKVFTADTNQILRRTHDYGIPQWPETGRLPFDDDLFAAVLAREVLEHVDRLPQMLREIRRVLVPGGRLWFSTPFIFPLHDYPGDYWRISDSGWRLLLSEAGFTNVLVRNERFLFNSWQLPCSVLGWAEG